MADFDVVGIGRPYFDQLLIVPHLPAADEVLQIKHYEPQGGGPVPTALVTLARLGASTAIWGTVGGDRQGDFVVADFDRYGVKRDHLIICPGTETAFSVILIDQATGTRSILYHRGNTPSLEPAGIDSATVARGKILHLSGSYQDAEIRAARLAKSLGVTVSFDGGVGLVRPGISELVDLADILVVARSFAEGVTDLSDLEACARNFLGRGPRTVVITDGVAGSWGWTQAGECHYQPAFRVEVEDTTGAGDVYHGAFVYGALRNWSLPQTLRFASAVAALKCMRVGGRAGIPTLSDVERFLADR
jgi:sulfofructose kinase